MSKTLILSKEVAYKKMQRIALEIAEQLFEAKEELIIIGINGSGMVVANQLQQLLHPLLTTGIQLITCNINKRQPVNITYSSDIDFTGKSILIVDDVTNSGRTLLYAIKPLLDYFPRRIQTMSLVERMHKSFPVKIDYIGLSIATTLQAHIQVEVSDNEITGAYIL